MKKKELIRMIRRVVFQKSVQFIHRKYNTGCSIERYNEILWNLSVARNKYKIWKNPLKYCRVYSARTTPLYLGTKQWKKTKPYNPNMIIGGLYDNLKYLEWCKRKERYSKFVRLEFRLFQVCNAEAQRHYSQDTPDKPIFKFEKHY